MTSKEPRSIIQALLFGVGGLIQAAVGLAGGMGGFVDEALWVFAKCLIESDLAGGVNGIGLAIMHLVGRHQADSGMVMVLVVPVEEAAAEASGILDAAEAFWEAWLILQRLEVAFGEWIVVGGVRAIVRTGDAEVRQQERGGLGLHRRRRGRHAV